jgi:hypothetical protein
VDEMVGVVVVEVMEVVNMVVVSATFVVVELVVDVPEWITVVGGIAGLH